MKALSSWRNTLRVARDLPSAAFVLASFGFVSDSTNMGRQLPLRFAVSVLLSGVFPACYAATGIALRGKFWKAFIPLFVLQFLCTGWLYNRLPALPQLVQFNAAETAHLHSRLGFDGVATIISICLGYTGLKASSSARDVAT